VKQIRVELIVIQEKLIGAGSRRRNTMSNNPIPDELRSEHLFLLVGTNPLPNWVAAKLLLRDAGKLYLIHSGTTFKVAERLAKFAVINKYQQPVYIPVNDEHDAESIAQAIQSQLQTIHSASIGLNYTGGTKVMAVHSYRAIDSLKNIEPVFSYLDAANFMLRFESIASQFPQGHRQSVGLDVPLKLEDIFSLHGDYKYKQDIKRDARCSQVGELLANLHSSEEGRKSWRAFCETRLKFGKAYPPPRGSRIGELRLERDLAQEKFSLSSGDRFISTQLEAIAEALIPGGTRKDKTLGEIERLHSQEISSATELAKWLDGMWLEDYTLHEINQLKTDQPHVDCPLSDCGRNIEIRKPILFEADVAAMRGYQLHLISCYTGSDDQRSRTKLFEVYTHAQQLGGEAARAALICCVGNPEYIQKQVGEVWGIQEQVRVFGRNDLKNIRSKLKDWFDSGAR
jgi:hypothetical protein